MLVVTGSDGKRWLRTFTSPNRQFLWFPSQVTRPYKRDRRILEFKTIDGNLFSDADV